MVFLLMLKRGPRVGSATTYGPAMMARNSSTTPMMEAPVTSPSRQTCRYTPIKSAMGMVANTVKVPQALSAMALTTAMESPARVRMRMNSTAQEATWPVTLPISLSAILPRLWPLCRTEAKRTTMSCTAPAMTQPMMIHSVPGI